MARLLVTLLCILFIHPSQAQSNGRKQLAVIAYYSGNATDIDRYAINKLTHIIYCFAGLKGNRLYVSPKSGVVLRKLVSFKKTHPALKVLLAFGGWGGCKTCSGIFSIPENRKTFAQSVRTTLDQYHLDGIDIDWEYPAVQGPIGQPFSPNDKQHFTELIQAIRTALGNTKEITIAAGAFTDYLQHAIEWKQVAALADRLHLMTFDLVNRNSIITGHHTALYSTHKQKLSVDNAIRYLDSLGIPHNKLVIGAAFYARIYEQVDSLNNGLHQPCRFKGFAVYKAYSKTFSSQNGFTCYRDSEAQAPWCYNAQKKLFATFDDVLSVQRKTQYAIDEQLYGIMFWELRQDTPHNGLLDAIYEVKRKQVLHSYIE